jgi:hypothetical protein
VYMVGGTVSNCVIRDNRGTVYGGGVDLSGGWLENCLIVNNTAAQNAGGVCGTGSGGGARNCTITGNRAGGSYWGGGFYAFAGNPLSKRFSTATTALDLFLLLPELINTPASRLCRRTA